MTLSTRVRARKGEKPLSKQAENENQFHAKEKDKCLHKPTFVKRHPNEFLNEPVY